MLEPRSLYRHAKRFIAANLVIVGPIVGLALVFGVAVGLPYHAGRTERWLTEAEGYADAGEDEAAFEAYDNAFETGDRWTAATPGSAPSRLRDESTLRGWAECGLRTGAALERRGHGSEAEEIYRRIIERVSDEDFARGVRAEAFWRLARCRKAAGDRPGTVAATASLILLVRARGNRADAEILERLAPALSDPDDPGHEIAMSRFGGGPDPVLAGQPGGWTPVEEWRRIAKHGEHAIPEILAALDAFEDASTGVLARDLCENLRRTCAEVSLTAGAELEDALAGAAASERFPVPGRTLATELLCRTADLPLWCEVPAADPTFIARALAMWVEVRTLDPVAAFAWKLDHLVASRPEVLEDGALDRPAIWFRDRAGARTAQPIRDWWATHRDDPPAKRLARALRLDSAVNAPTASGTLRRFWASPRNDRRLMHHLIGLLAPEGVARPSGGQGSVAWPDGTDLGPSGDEIARAWSRALRNRPEPALHRVRIAALLVRDRGAAPSLLWESVRPIRIGETVAVHQSGRVEWADTPGRTPPREWSHVIQVPGRRLVAGTGYRRASPSGCALETTVAIRLDPGSWRGPEIGWITPTPLTGNPAAGAPEGYVTQRVRSRVDQVNGSPRVIVVVLLALLEKADAPEGSDGIDRWREAVASNLRRFARDAPDLTPMGRWLWFRLVYNLSRPAAALLWTDECSQAAREVTALANDPAAGDASVEERRAYGILARLHADEGPEAAELDAAREASDPVGPPAVRRIYWERHLLKTRSPAVYDLARRELTSLAQAGPGPGGGLPFLLMTDLVEKGRELGISPEPAAAAAVERAARTPPYVVWLGLWAGLVVITLVLAIRRKVKPDARLRPAALLVALGILLAANHVEVAGDALPLEVIGLLVATVGVWITALAIPGATRWLAPIGLAVATLAMLGRGLVPADVDGPATRLVAERLGMFRDVGLLVGLGALPILAWILMRAYRQSLPRRVVRHLAVAAPIIGLTAVATYTVLPSVIGNRTIYFAPGPFAETVALAMLAPMAWVLAKKRTYPGEIHRSIGPRGFRLPSEVRILASPPGILIGFCAILLATDGGRRYLVPEGWAGASPALWLGIAAGLLALLLSAHRASNAPPLWRRLLTRRGRGREVADGARK